MVSSKPAKFKNIDMTQGSIVKGLVLYAIPIILSDFLQQLYNSVDSIIVGNLVGKTALAAVGQTFFIINMYLGLSLGISLGTTVVISRYFGAKDYAKLNKSIDTSIKLTIWLSVFFTAVGVLTIPWMLKLVGSTADAYEESRTYLRIYLGGIAAQLFYNMLSSILKAIGDSRRPLYVLAFTTVLNIFLDYFMVGPLKMGVAGAAYATVIAQILSSVLLWIMIVRTPIFEKPIIKHGRMDKKILKDIFVIGFPYSVQRTITSVSNTVVMSFVNFFGSGPMAGWSVYQKVDQFTIGTIISLSSGVTTFVSQNVGAKKYSRIRKGVRTAMIMTVGMSAFYALVFCTFRTQVSTLFSQDPEVIKYGSYVLVSLMPIQIVTSFSQAQAGAMRGLGDGIKPTVILTFCFVVVRQIYLHLRWQSYQELSMVIKAFHFSWIACVIIMTVFYILDIRSLLGNKQDGE